MEWGESRARETEPETREPGAIPHRQRETGWAGIGARGSVQQDEHANPSTTAPPGPLDSPGHHGEIEESKKSKPGAFLLLMQINKKSSRFDCFEELANGCLVYLNLPDNVIGFWFPFINDVYKLSRPLTRLSALVLATYPVFRFAANTSDVGRPKSC